MNKRYYPDPFGPTQRAKLAEKAGMSERLLYQCLTGRASLSAAEAVRVERATGFKLRRWLLRRHDWHETWPELVRHHLAPGLPPAGAIPETK